MHKRPHIKGHAEGRRRRINRWWVQGSRCLRRTSEVFQGAPLMAKTFCVKTWRPI